MSFSIFRIAIVFNVFSFLFDFRCDFTHFKAEKDRSVEQLHGVHNDVLITANIITM